MSGGIAYVLDEDGRVRTRVNPETVDLDPLDRRGRRDHPAPGANHFKYTRSKKADEVLRKWDHPGAQVREGLPEGLQAGARRVARVAAESGNG